MPFVVGLDQFTKAWQKTCGIQNHKKNQDHPDYSIVKCGYNTQKSPGDLRRLAVTQTQGKDH